jgi:threonyl-tRNA synthetase
MGLWSGCRAFTSPAAGAADRKAQRAEAQAELNQFLYGHVPASSVQEEYAKGGVMSDADLPRPAMPLHSNNFRFFKNPLYTSEQVQNVKITHRPPMGVMDRVALSSVGVMRTAFDKTTGYPNLKSERDWLHRILFLETVAGVPGFVAGMFRHLRSLRRLQRDQGWIHTLLEEAENERMHLLTFMHLKQPGILFRIAVLLTQGVFANGFILAYLLSPQLCHRFVGYLEEEAVRTYTHCLQVIDTPGSALHEWTWQPAPDLAKEYWRLASDATMRDVIEVVRADEACHRHVNHVFSSIDYDNRNPFGPQGISELGTAPCEKEVLEAPKAH